MCFLPSILMTAARDVSLRMPFLGAGEGFEREVELAEIETGEVGEDEFAPSDTSCCWLMPRPTPRTTAKMTRLMRTDIIQMSPLFDAMLFVTGCGSTAYGAVRSGASSNWSLSGACCKPCSMFTYGQVRNSNMKAIY